MVAVEPRERLAAFVADVCEGFDRRSQRDKRRAVCAWADRAGAAQELAADAVSAGRVGCAV